MLINIHGAKCIGINAVPVTIEVDIRQGIGIHLVGLADAAVKESLLLAFKTPGAVELSIPPAQACGRGRVRQPVCSDFLWTTLPGISHAGSRPRYHSATNRQSPYPPTSLVLLPSFLPSKRQPGAEVSPG